MTPTPPVPEIEKLRDDIHEESRNLIHEAASWREAADSTGGHTASALMRDALDNERQAAQLESWVERIEAILPALRAETQARQEAETQRDEANRKYNAEFANVGARSAMYAEQTALLTAERVARQQADARIERLITESKGYADALRVESEARQQAETVLAQSIVQRDLQESVIRHETQRREQAERELTSHRRAFDISEQTVTARDEELARRQETCADLLGRLEQAERERDDALGQVRALCADLLLAKSAAPSDVVRFLADCGGKAAISDYSNTATVRGHVAEACPWLSASSIERMVEVLKVELTASEQARQAMQRSLNLCEDHQPDRWEGDGTCVLCEGDCLAVLLRQTEVALAASEQARARAEQAHAAVVNHLGLPPETIGVDIAAHILRLRAAESSLASLRTALERISTHDGERLTEDADGYLTIWQDTPQEIAAAALATFAGTSTTPRA